MNEHFPEASKTVLKMRTDTKLLNFDLANTIQDVSLLADSSVTNSSRVVRKLALRKKWIDQGKLSPEYDHKIWKYVVKRQVTSLDDQAVKGQKIVENLKKINEGNVEIQKTLEKEVEFMEAALEKKTRLQAYEMRELE